LSPTTVRWAAAAKKDGKDGKGQRIAKPSEEKLEKKAEEAKRQKAEQKAGGKLGNASGSLKTAQAKMLAPHFNQEPSCKIFSNPLPYPPTKFA